MVGFLRGHAISAGRFKAVNWCLLLITAVADSPAQDDRNSALLALTGYQQRLDGFQNTKYRFA